MAFEWIYAHHNPPTLLEVDRNGGVSVTTRYREPWNPSS